MVVVVVLVVDIVVVAIVVVMVVVVVLVVDIVVVAIVVVMVVVAMAPLAAHCSAIVACSCRVMACPSQCSFSRWCCFLLKRQRQRPRRAGVPHLGPNLQQCSPLGTSS